MRGTCKRAESECRFAHPQDSVSSHEDGSVTVCMDAVKGRCAREPCRYFHPPLHLQAQIKAAQTRATAVWLYNLIQKKKNKPTKQTNNPKINEKKKRKIYSKIFKNEEEMKNECGDALRICLFVFIFLLHNDKDVCFVVFFS